MDVARFKYPPHWVPLSALFSAMQSIDESSQQSRGFLVIGRRPDPSSAGAVSLALLFGPGMSISSAGRMLQPLKAAVEHAGEKDDPIPALVDTLLKIAPTPGSPSADVGSNEHLVSVRPLPLASRCPPCRVHAV
jgi:hypothetical protein